MKKKTTTFLLLAIIILLISSVVIIYLRSNDESNNSVNETEQTTVYSGVDVNLVKRIAKIEKQVNEINNKLMRIKRNITILTLFIITVSLLFILGFFIKSKTYKNNSNRSRIPDDFESEINVKFSRLEEKSQKSYSTIRVLLRKIEDLENNFSGLQKSNKILTNEAEVNPVSMPKEEDESEDRIIASSNIKYLKGKTGDEFKREVNNADFETFYSLEKNGNTGTFRFCGNQENALGSFNAIFDNVCDYEGDPTRAKKIVNVESGMVELVEGNWKVIKKAKIKLE